jgi:glycosyltransferase involved in cell wall biosynthesis
VDDGSRQTPPALIGRWGSAFPVTIVRRPHLGAATARNRGVQSSRGSSLVFMDADCRPQKTCLAALNSTMTESPAHDCFQLRLVGDCSKLVGRAEELRLISIQEHMVQSNGCIRYLNTAGFAVRRERAVAEKELFDSTAPRSEDTFFLVKLMKSGELPFFVRSAVVQHVISLPLTSCLLKDIRSGYLEGKANRKIATTGIRIRVTPLERLRMLWTMWRTAGQSSIGKAGYFVLLLRQILERTTSAVCQRLLPS